MTFTLVKPNSDIFVN